MSEASAETTATSARRVRPARKLTGVVSVPGDKSISHRALMLAAVARGESHIRNLAPGADVASTQHVLGQLGVRFRQDGENLIVSGVGRDGFGGVDAPLDCGNSGTTIRLLAGLLAGTARSYTLTGDESLRSRPMNRIAAPLHQMGVGIEMAEGGRPPLIVRGGHARPLDLRMDVASAQVKSAVLLAALSAEGMTHIHEPMPSRDHTEIMLAQMGAPIRTEQVVEQVEPADPRRRGTRRTDERRITLLGPVDLEGGELSVPGDFSTAAYFVAAGLLVRRSDLRIPGIGANSTRTGLLAVLSTMGARFTWHHRKTVCGEPVGDLHVEATSLSARKVSGKLLPRLIAGLPLLAVLATQADGTTVIRDAAELRHKESDRIELVADNLRRMGARVGTLEDGLAIEGPTPLSGADITSAGDHRSAMTVAVAALIADGETEIDDADCVRISCPGFFDMLDALR